MCALGGGEFEARSWLHRYCSPRQGRRARASGLQRRGTDPARGAGAAGVAGVVSRCGPGVIVAGSERPAISVAFADPRGCVRSQLVTGKWAHGEVPPRWSASPVNLVRTRNRIPGRALTRYGMTPLSTRPLVSGCGLAACDKEPLPQATSCHVSPASAIRRE